MGLIEGIGAVVRFELLRFLRWRRYWRLLLGGGAVLFTLTLSGLWVVVLAQRNGDATPAVQVVLAITLAAPGAMGLWTIIRLVRRIFSDQTSRGELFDLYLTALCPTEIVLGRLIAAWLLTGLSMLAVLPAPLLFAQLVSVSLDRVIIGALTAWAATLLWGAIEAWTWLFGQKAPPSDSRSGISDFYFHFWIVYAYIIYLLRGKPLGNAGSLILGFSPITAALEAGARYRLSIVEFSAYWAIGALTLALSVPIAVAVAVRYGEWTLEARRFVRTVGGGVYLLLIALLTGLATMHAVRALSDAERLVFWFTAVGGMTAVAWGRSTWGLWTLPRVLPARGLRPPWDGIMWEGAMLWGIALFAWFIVGLISGFWASPMRLLLSTGYLWTLLTLIHALEAPRFLELPRVLASCRGTIPIEVRRAWDIKLFEGCLIPPVILIMFLAASATPSWSARLQWLLIAARFTPLGALTVAPLRDYLLYGGYALVVSGWLFWRARRKALREQGALPEDKGYSAGGYDRGTER